MASTSENTFGAKLQRGSSLLTYVKTFEEFSPPRDQDKPDNLKILLDNILDANAKVAKGKQAYTLAVNQRQQMFKNSPASMLKMLSPINGSVVAQYGKDSVEYKLIAAIIKKIRSANIEKAPSNPDASKAEERISRSSRSYGSLTQYFKDIVTNLEQFDDFKPSNMKLSIENLTIFSDSLTEANQAVTLTYGERAKIIATRLALYADLKDRVSRIKGYTKSVYGNKSQEFKLIKG